MNGHEHERAMELITRRDVEGIAASDAKWLELHLDGCAECAGFELAMGDAEQALRSFAVMAPVALVEATKARVHLRAEQLRERDARRFLIAISFAMGMVVSTMSAWAWWEVGGWMVERFSLPSVIVGPGLVLFWLLPSIFLGMMLVAFPESRFEGSLMQLFVRDRQGGSQ
jgi:predicted anti-sigma-YlaC factor YlaD